MRIRVIIKLICVGIFFCFFKEKNDNLETGILNEAQKTIKDAETAAQIQDQLQFRIRLSEQKKLILEKLHEKNQQKRTEEENSELEKVEFAKLKGIPFIYFFFLYKWRRN